MTNEERAALVERLRDNNWYENVTDDITRWADSRTEAADQIKADGKRIAELEAEVERLTYDGIHSCHDQCQRVACVLERRVGELENNLLKAAHEILGLKDALAQVGDNHDY